MSTGDVFLSVSAQAPNNAKRMLSPLIEDDENENPIQKVSAEPNFGAIYEDDELNTETGKDIFITENTRTEFEDENKNIRNQSTPAYSATELDQPECVDGSHDQTKSDVINRHRSNSAGDMFDEIYSDRDSSEESNDDDYETDLEVDEEKWLYPERFDLDLTGEQKYIKVCEDMGISPTTYFIKHIQDRELKMKFHGLGPQRMKALSVPLQTNTNIEILNLEGNAIDSEGAICLTKVLKENFFITELLISAYDREQALAENMQCDDNLENVTECGPSEMEDHEISGPTTASVSCQVKPRQVSKQCQTRSRLSNDPGVCKRMVSRGIQTDPVLIQPEKPVTRDAFQLVRPEYLEKRVKAKKCTNTVNESNIDNPFLSPMKDDMNDPNYEPLASPLSDGPNSEYRDEEGYEEVQQTGTAESMTKYLVFEKNLLELFKTCQKCSNETQGQIVYTNGSMVKVRQKCRACLFDWSWFSQPFVGNKPAGNLMISAGILFTGMIPRKTLRMMKFNKIASISLSTYMSHQKYFLYPAIEHVWRNFQEDYISDVLSDGRSIAVGGDGRADTPGHSAKYGSYTLLDLDEGVVVDIQLVQSNEVKSSTHMEKEGLVRCIEYLQSRNVTIKSIVTDRHVQIVKWIRENLTETEHCFDVWHVAKGLKKKLFSLSKEKDCGELTGWIKSLVNHLYWTAASSAGEDDSVKFSKWLSVLNHIRNVHSGHSDLFTTCQHGDLEGKERKKRWLKPGTKVYEKLDDIINTRQMKRDIPMLSAHHQTSALEGYHSVINHFAPKMIGFSYHGMLSRLWLAALHFNENSQRDQAHTADGQPRYSIVYPKYKKGEFTVRKIPVECTYNYVEVLMSSVFRMGEMAHMNSKGFQLHVQAPPPLSSQYERPDQQTAVRSLLSRFNESQQGGSLCTAD